MYKSDIPNTKSYKNLMPNEEVLNNMRQLVNSYLIDTNLTPPIQQGHLFSLASNFLLIHPNFTPYFKLIVILINNHIWENIVASIPFKKRVLLLPKCIQDSKKCNAKTDELGLLCELCGGCKLTDYITTAEQLGYNVIVSEGSGTVSVLLNSGQIECVVGVACLESFERTFPISLKQAIPSIAIPLYNSNCKNSKTNEPWLNEALQLSDTSKTLKQVDLKEIQAKSNSWFSPEYLNKLFPPNNQTTVIANQWLQAGGKRWRPVIMTALYNALSSNSDNHGVLPKLAIAIESFHKASLAHDDIVDNDTTRYGEASLLKEHSMEITLNTGDLLLSYGYQLIAESGLDSPEIKKLIVAASNAHRELCLGQGEELIWQQQSGMPSMEKVIEIFALKTAPAFEVSLVFGAIASKAINNLYPILKEYSKAIGIAYQIQDDINDFNPDHISNDIIEYRPSLILAILNEKNPEGLAAFLNDTQANNKRKAENIYNWATANGTIDEAKKMLDTYKDYALNSLNNLHNVSAKVLLYRLLNKIIQ